MKSRSRNVGDYKYISCVPGVDGKIHPESVVQHRLAARSPMISENFNTHQY